MCKSFPRTDFQLLLKTEVHNLVVKLLLEFGNTLSVFGTVILNQRKKQQKRHLEVGCDVERGAESSHAYSCALWDDGWWHKMTLFHVPLSFMSYSIKLLAVQELLDKEALEKVNILFFLPHKQNSDPQPEDLLTALTAEGACFFVLPTGSEPCRLSVKASRHAPFTLTDLNLPCSFQTLRQQRLACRQPGHLLKKVSCASKQQKQEQGLPRASLQACCPFLSAACLIIRVFG